MRNVERSTSLFVWLLGLIKCFLESRHDLLVGKSWGLTLNDNTCLVVGVEDLLGFLRLLRRHDRLTRFALLCFANSLHFAPFILAPKPELFLGCTNAHDLHKDRLRSIECSALLFYVIRQ